MRLHCLGINYQSADVNIRELLAFRPEQTQDFWNYIQKEYNDLLDECVILSTCNRVEIYAVSQSPIFEKLEEALLKFQKIDASLIEDLFYKRVDEQVIAHLMRVSAGLDSMVLGEPQILGQVTDAYKLGLELKICGKVLSKLFQSAIRAGKRVRTETDISKNSMSVSSLAAKMVEQSVADIKNIQITLLGAGQMAELAVEALKKRGVKNFLVISRTISSACGLAEKWNGRAGSFDKLAGALEETDVLISSTSAPHTLIHREMIEKLMAKRSDRPMVIIDIAVPRDVASDVAEVENVKLYDIDTLNHDIEKAIEGREREIPKVEQIIDYEYQEFKDFFHSLRYIPVIAGMRQHADGIRQRELDKTLKKMHYLNPKDQERIKALTHSIVQKILHEPTVKLREEAKGSNGERYAFAVSELFGLNNKNSNSK